MAKTPTPHRPTKPHPLHLVDREPYSLTWLGCRRAKPKHYLTHLPCYFFLFSDFGFFLLHAFVCGCCFCFLSSCLFARDMFGFSCSSLYTKDMGLYGSNTLYSIKRVFDPICPNLLKSFCWWNVLSFSSFTLFLSVEVLKEVLTFIDSSILFIQKGLEPVEFGGRDTSAHVSMRLNLIAHVLWV